MKVRVLRRGKEKGNERGGGLGEKDVEEEGLVKDDERGRSERIALAAMVVLGTVEFYQWGFAGGYLKLEGAHAFKIGRAHV